MPPEAIIKALQERVARQRMLKEKFENELEAIVQAETERAFANLDEDKRASRRPVVFVSISRGRGWFLFRF